MADGWMIQMHLRLSVIWSIACCAVRPVVSFLLDLWKKREIREVERSKLAEDYEVHSDKKHSWARALYNTFHGEWGFRIWPVATIMPFHVLLGKSKDHPASIQHNQNLPSQRQESILDMDRSNGPLVKRPCLERPSENIPQEMSAHGTRPNPDGKGTDVCVNDVTPETEDSGAAEPTCALDWSKAGWRPTYPTWQQQWEFV